jgi:Mg-chelatase subunit ChlD
MVQSVVTHFADTANQWAPFAELSKQNGNSTSASLEQNDLLMRMQSGAQAQSSAINEDGFLGSLEWRANDTRLAANELAHDLAQAESIRRSRVDSFANAGTLELPKMAFVPQSQAVAGADIGLPLTTTLPLPEAYASTNGWYAFVVSRTNGSSNSVGIPVFADTPLSGNLFAGRTEASPAAEFAKTRGAPPVDQESVMKRSLVEQAKAEPLVAGVIVSGVPTAPKANIQYDEAAPRKPTVLPPTPQPEIQTRDNAFSTFSLNVSDVSFKLAAASLQNGTLPDAATVRSEEFINAFDYRDPEAAPGAALSFASERAGYPLAPNRDLLRFSVKTAAQGRQAGRALNLVLLLDKSGSMERADRVAIIREALRVLAAQLQPQDRVSVVVFSRTARLWADGVPGSQLASLVDALEALTPEGGTNLEEAMRLAYETAFRHYLANGENRVVLLTDGAANLGDVEPEDLKKKVVANRTQGVALDCFGVGWEDYNDNLLEVISRAGGGRYGFINTPEEAATGFAGQLAGALRVAASDVKVQVEFNPARVIAYRQIGYAKDQLKKEEFRDNTVKAAQMGAAESGNALYTVEINPAGDGPICTVYARYREPGTQLYHEHEWQVPYTGTAAALDQASPAMRLAAAASAFSEWLAGSPYAGGVTPDQLLGYLRGVPEVYGADARPKLLETMIREAKSISGK